MALRYGFNFFLLCIIVLNCDDIPHDNLLDPKNPVGYRESTILLEAFVNTNDTIPISINYSLLALQALDSIKQIYGSQVVMVEYHRNISAYSDPYHKQIFEDLYTKYVKNSQSGVKGVPDIFINGVEYRIQGASSVSSVITRLSPIISELVVQRNEYTLEFGNLNFAGNTLTAECKYARLGNQSARDLLIKIVLLQRINAQELKRVAVHFEKSQSIPFLQAGEIKTQHFSITNLADKPDRVLLTLTSADELTVYQTMMIDVL